MQSRVNQLLSLANGNPQGLFNSLVQSNPRFAQFVAQNQGKTPEQAFRDNGIDYSQVRRYL